MLMVPDPDLNNELYSWPKPQMETERWRYVTIKECRASLRKPVPSQYDIRVKLKEGFKVSLDALRDELTSMLREVAELDDASALILRKVTIKAATMWLEFGVQRCRLLLILPGSDVELMGEGGLGRQGDVLDLVDLPLLKRFGNSKGLDLNVKEVVQGCDSRIVQVSTRNK